MTTCRHCDHDKASHDHLRAGSECSEEGCDCTHFAHHLLPHELPHLELHHEHPKPIAHPIEL